MLRGNNGTKPERQPLMPPQAAAPGGTSAHEVIERPAVRRSEFQFDPYRSKINFDIIIIQNS